MISPTWRRRSVARPSGRATAAAVALLATVASACGSGADVASDVCGEVQRPQLQEGSHLIGDTPPPVPYTSTPPTSGWHRSGAPRLGVIPENDPLTDPELVSALEAGDVVAAYDPARLPQESVDRLRTLGDGTHAGSLTVTPYTGADAPLSLASWGVLRGCQDLDEDALDAFVREHRASGLDHER